MKSAIVVGLALFFWYAIVPICVIAVLAWLFLKVIGSMAEDTPGPAPW